MQVLAPRMILPVLLVLALSATVGLLGAGCAPKAQPTREELVARAEAHLKAGRFHQAFSDLTQALKEDPNNIQVHVDLGWLYLYTRQMDKALDEIRRIESLDPGTDKVHYLKGAVYEHLGQWADALEAYNDALKTDINNPELHADIAGVFLEVNSPDAALREYNVALRLDPKNSAYGFGRCVALRQLKKYNLAVHACEQALHWTRDEREKERINQVIQTIHLLKQLAPDEKDA